MAMIIDWIIIQIVANIINFIQPTTYLIYVEYLILLIAYRTYFVGKFGQTPGKMITKIKIIKSNKSKLTYSEAFFREFIAKIVSQLSIIGFPWAIFDNRNQAFHDKMADTLVINHHTN